MSRKTTNRTIFDADAVAREKWDVTAPATDPLYFFSASTVSDLSDSEESVPEDRHAFGESRGDGRALQLVR